MLRQPLGAGSWWASPWAATRHALARAPRVLLTALLAVLSCCGIRPAFAACPEYVGAGNFSIDLEGGVLPGDDERPEIWGERGSWVFPLTFKPGEGETVRVLEINADVQAWPTRRGAGPSAIPEGEYVGYLAAVGTNPASMGSARADWMADDVFAYWQGQADSAGGGEREAFRADLRGVENNRLGPQHKLYFTLAKYLDTTGVDLLHMELTFVVRYAFCAVDR